MRSEILQGRNKTVGIRETSRALDKDLVEQVIVAKDADLRVLQDIIDTCEKNHISIIEVDSMAELGKACSVQVKTSVAGLLK